MIKDYKKYLNYTNVDFLGTRNEILANLTEFLPEYSLTQENDLGMFLIDQVSMANEVLHTYYNVIHNELNPNSMQLKSSILNYLEWYNYPHILPTSASVLIHLIVDTIASPVTLTAGTNFYAKYLNQDITFTLIDDYFFPQGVDRLFLTELSLFADVNYTEITVLSSGNYKVDDYIFIEHINGDYYEAKRIIKIEGNVLTLDFPLLSYYPAGSSVNKLIVARQGRQILNKLVGYGTGEEGQIYPLRDGNVHITEEYNKLISVTVGNEIYDVVDSFINKEINQYSPVFKVGCNNYGEHYIEFGAGGFGKIPPLDSDITVTYLAADGSLGNIPKGAITECDDANVLYLFNPYEGSGGSDYMSTKQVKEDFKAWRKSKKVGFNADTIIAIAKGMPEVKNAYCVVDGKVIRLIIQPTLGILTEQNRVKIYKYFVEDKLMGGYVLTVEDVVKDLLNINIEIKVKSFYDENIIFILFNEIFADLFTNKLNSFGGSLYANNIHDAVNEDIEKRTLLYENGMLGFDVTNISFTNGDIRETIKALDTRILAIGNLNMTFSIIS